MTVWPQKVQRTRARSLILFSINWMNYDWKYCSVANTLHPPNLGSVLLNLTDLYSFSKGRNLKRNERIEFLCDCFSWNKGVFYNWKRRFSAYCQKKNLTNAPWIFSYPVKKEAMNIFKLAPAVLKAFWASINWSNFLWLQVMRARWSCATFSML